MNLEQKLAMELGLRDLQIIKLSAENEALKEELEKVKNEKDEVVEKIVENVSGPKGV